MSQLRPSASQLARLAQELHSDAEGGILQDCRVSGPELLSLTIRVPGRTIHLALSLHGEAAGPFLEARKPRRDTSSEGGTNFWQLLRAACSAASLERVRVPPGERTLLLELRRGAERSMVAAAFHGRPNVILLRDESVIGDLRGRVTKGSTLDDLLRSAPSGKPREEPPVVSLEVWSERLRSARSAALAGARIDSLRSALRSARTAASGRAEKRLADAERLGETGELRRQAEALSAHLHTLKRGDTELALEGWPDPENDEPVRVPLEASREPADTLQRLWQRVRKADRGRDEALGRAQEAEEEAERFAAWLGELDALDAGARAAEAEALEALDRLSDEAGAKLPKPKGRGPGGKKSDSPALPFRRFTSHDGIPILVGRSSRANDELSFRVAAGNDIWLHAQGVAGSHVVIKLPRGVEVPQETLLDAATLAHVHSKRKSDSHGEVSWCRAKHVSKRKGAPAGQVMITQEKSLRVRVEPERLARLKATEE